MEKLSITPHKPLGTPETQQHASCAVISQNCWCYQACFCCAVKLDQPHQQYNSMEPEGIQLCPLPHCSTLGPHPNTLQVF